MEFNSQLLKDIINDIEISISLNQRLTLEDKAIVELLIKFKQLIQNNLDNLAGLNNKQEILKDIHSSIKEYIKMVRFNYNYYEQYFAYNFLIKLQSVFEKFVS